MTENEEPANNESIRREEDIPEGASQVYRAIRADGIHVTVVRVDGGWDEVLEFRDRLQEEDRRLGFVVVESTAGGIQQLDPGAPDLAERFGRMALGVSDLDVEGWMQLAREIDDSNVGQADAQPAGPTQ